MVTCYVAGLDIGWWWLNVVDVGKSKRQGWAWWAWCFFQGFRGLDLIQVNGKFLFFS